MVSLNCIKNLDSQPKGGHIGRESGCNCNGRGMELAAPANKNICSELKLCFIFRRGLMAKLFKIITSGRGEARSPSSASSAIKATSFSPISKKYSSSLPSMTSFFSLLGGAASVATVHPDPQDTQTPCLSLPLAASGCFAHE